MSSTCRILWGDRLTSSSVQSPDGKATYVQLNLAGNQGTALGDESVAAVRDIVNRTPPPAGVNVYVTGAAPLASDMQHSGNNSILKITVVTVVIIFTMLLFVYRSIVDRDSAVGHGWRRIGGGPRNRRVSRRQRVLVLSTFAVNMLVFLSIAAGTDYGIFFFGRYQEARQAGEDPETAYYTTYRSVAPVVLASGLTIAGAIFCLSFTRLPYFQTMGIPCAVGMLVCGRGRGDVGSCRDCRGQPVWATGTQAQVAGSSMARNRHGDRPLARAHPGCRSRARADRSADTAGL